MGNLVSSNAIAPQITALRVFNYQITQLPNFKIAVQTVYTVQGELCNQEITGKECFAGGPTIKADSAELNNAAAVQAPRVGGAWRTVRSFILWSHERGTVQYDVMVTLILLFVFFSPKLINFNDKPVERNPHSTGVVVYGDSDGGLVYEVNSKAVQAGDDAALRAQLIRIIEPISGEISISKYEAVKDKKGKVLSYRVWVTR